MPDPHSGLGRRREPHRRGGKGATPHRPAIGLAPPSVCAPWGLLFGPVRQIYAPRRLHRRGIGGDSIVARRRFDSERGRSVQTDAAVPVGTQGRPLRAGLVISALGVVFGDIGTSPIYTLQTLFNPADPHPVPINRANVYGVVSLIFWSVMTIVTLTYVLLVMRADNDGEGGVMALITLVRRLGGCPERGSPRRWQPQESPRRGTVLRRPGDHPAISVLSAVEGLNVVDPGLADFRGAPTGAGSSSALLRAAARHRGGGGSFRTGDGRLVRGDRNAGLLRNRRASADFARALPMYALEFMVGHFHIAFFALAAVVLAVTGARRCTPIWGTSAGRRSPGLGGAGVAGAGAQLLRAGGAADREPGRGERTVLHARPGLGADTGGRAVNRRDGDAHRR